MKLSLLFFISVSAVIAAAQSFDVRCPFCLNKQVLTATSVLTTGGVSTNVAGISGNMEQRIANLHCPECHSDFTAPIKPDRFVPTMFATQVGPMPMAPRRMGMATPATTTLTNATEEVIRVIPQPDGSELVVIRRTPKK